MAKPKKPKMLKKPRKPQSKTIASMERYLDRVKEVDKENNRRESEYKKDLKKWEALKNKVARA